MHINWYNGEKGWVKFFYSLLLTGNCPSNEGKTITIRETFFILLTLKPF